MNYKKEICFHERLNRYVILVPVFYEFENRPAWRTVYGGTKTECEKMFDSFPDTLKASTEDNAKNRKNKMQEMLFLYSIGRNKKADAIKKQYHFA